MTSKLTTDPQKWPEMTQIPKIGPLISRKLMPTQQKNMTPHFLPRAMQYTKF